MQAQETSIFEDDSDEARRSVHDVAAAIISVRALAETLAEHVPTLVAMSRAKNSAKQAHIPPATLDSLPSIPHEIIKLCEIARDAVTELDCKSGAIETLSKVATYEPPRTARIRAARHYEKIDFDGAKILLVEDDEAARSVLIQSLQTHGFGVTSAAYGEEALRLLDKTDFDLVLMDLRLPGMSGWETTTRLRQKESAQGRYTHIVGLTASPMLQDHARAKAAGMDDVLVKPIDVSALRSVYDRFAGSPT